MKSGVFILPAALQAAGDTFAEQMGWGPGVYSIALSPTGAAPVTHYACRADLTEGFFALMADPPVGAAPLLAELILDVQEGVDPYAHWVGVLAAQGLQVVSADGP